MSVPIHGRTTIALLLAIIAAISAVQTSGVMPSSVSADNTLSIQLLRAPTSTESPSATGNVEINLQNGQIKFELHRATPNSAYVALFVPGASSIQLGLLSTGNGGEGNLQTSLSSGAYVGIFELTKDGLLQFISASVSFTIGLTGSVSVSSMVTSQTTSSQTTSTATQATITGTSQFAFQVEPAFRSISAGSFAKFNIRIEIRGGATVLLVARGVPDHSVAIFTPQVGTANPEFHSTLTLITSADTPPRTYGISVVAIINAVEFISQVGLEVTGSSTTTTSQTSTTSTTVSVGVGLSISLDTDRHQYERNATVTLQGRVTDDSGSAVADANVSVQVDAPSGAEVIFVSNLKTDAAGIFQVNFKLPANATAGTYTVFATASKAGRTSATTHTTFVVGTSSTPSVVIREVYATDTSGTRSAVFSRGQTVLVWVVVENSGASFQGVIWVQIRDPNGTPVSIQLQISPLNTGGTVKVAFGFTALASLPLGLYTANALVSDKMISQGGSFLASANADFALTG